MTTLDLLYFAWVREGIGRDGETRTFDETVRTVGDAVRTLQEDGGGYAEALTDIERLRFALDGKFVEEHAAIGGAKELGIFPPVTGG